MTEPRTISDLLDEIGDVQIMFWSCPEHNRGYVVWGDDGIARCQTDGCPQSSALPRVLSVVVHQRCNSYALQDDDCMFPGTVLRSYIDARAARTYADRWNVGHAQTHPGVQRPCEVSVCPTYIFTEGTD